MALGSFILAVASSLAFSRSFERDGARAGERTGGADATEVLCTLPSAARLVSLAKC